MTDKELGDLTPVELRDIWANEASDFTPWLAQEENLKRLSNTLGIDLQLEAQEKAVGPFSADILCKDSNSDAWVLIENQLEKTNHTHLGQLLTYASGLEAVVVVWIAKAFTDEHRSALDWLNSITDPSFRFFGIEVELWKIGDSLAAPRFNVVAKPNNWSRSAARAASAIDAAEHSETAARHRAYWDAFCSLLRERPPGPISGERTPNERNWMGWGVGRTGFRVNASTAAWDRRIRVELYIAGAAAKAHFHLLEQQKEDIERELGYPLVWRAVPKYQDCSMDVTLEGVDPTDESSWPKQHEWLADKLAELHKVFSVRVRELNADDWHPLSEDEGGGEDAR